MYDHQTSYYPSSPFSGFQGDVVSILVSRVIILKAMLDLDALTWRLWKLGMPRVHCLDGSYGKRSYSTFVRNYKCFLLFEIIRTCSKAFVLCILLLCWTYAMDEDVNTPLVSQKSIILVIYTSEIFWINYKSFRPHPLQEFQWLEYFAGEANLTTVIHGFGHVQLWKV